VWGINREENMKLKEPQIKCLEMLDAFLAELKKQFLLKGDAPTRKDGEVLLDTLMASPTKV
jgi:hypothetical protein